MPQPESSPCELCWIQKEFGPETICRSPDQSCTVADLENVPMPQSMEALRERLAGADDAILQETGPTQGVVICTFRRSRKILEELGAIRLTRGSRTFTFPMEVK